MGGRFELDKISFEYSEPAVFSRFVVLSKFLDKLGIVDLYYQGDKIRFTIKYMVEHYNQTELLIPEIPYYVKDRVDRP